MARSISVVIPVYNSANSLEELYQRLYNTLSRITDNYEIIMVDDHSGDNSYQEITKLHRKDNRVKGIRLAKNSGQQNALFCGFKHIKGDYVLTLDDDLQHNPEDIISLYRTICKDYEVVYGIPEEREYSSLYRRIGSKLTNLLFDIITHKDSDIRVSSFRIMKKGLVNKIIKHQGTFVYISALILNNTARIANVNVSHSKRSYGKSNYNFFKLLKLFLRLYIYHGNSSFLKLFRSKKPQYIIKEKIGLGSN